MWIPSDNSVLGESKVIHGFSPEQGIGTPHLTLLEGPPNSHGGEAGRGVFGGL